MWVFNGTEAAHSCQIDFSALVFAQQALGVFVTVVGSFMVGNCNDLGCCIVYCETQAAAVMQAALLIALDHHVDLIWPCTRILMFDGR